VQHQRLRRIWHRDVAGTPRTGFAGLAGPQHLLEHVKQENLRLAKQGLMGVRAGSAVARELPANRLGLAVQHCSPEAGSPLVTPPALHAAVSSIAYFFTCTLKVCLLQAPTAAARPQEYCSITRSHSLLLAFAQQQTLVAHPARYCSSCTPPWRGVTPVCST
jgi:hypothetical protein